MDQHAENILKTDLTWLQRCAAFCRAHGAPHYYRDWSALGLLEYLNFHAQQETLQVVERAGQIIGLGLAFQWREQELRAALAAGQPMFQWQRTDGSGDSLLLGHFISIAPGAFTELAKRFDRRFPGWRSLKVFTLRRQRCGGHKLVQYPARTLQRIAHAKG